MKYCKFDCAYLNIKTKKTGKTIPSCKKFFNTNGGYEIRLRYEGNVILKCYACLKKTEKIN